MAYNPQPTLGQTSMSGSLPVAIANNQTAVPVAATAAFANGYSVQSGTIGNTATNIGTANTAGIVGGWYIYNPNTTVAYVQFFNAQASSVTVGSSPAPIYSIGIPGLSAANLMAPIGITHSTAICIAITTGRSNGTNPSSTVDYTIFYKQNV